MGNHSETGDVLEEARSMALEEGYYYSKTKHLRNTHNRAIRLDDSPEERENLLFELDPKLEKRMKDRAGRLIIMESHDTWVEPKGIRKPRKKK